GLCLGHCNNGKFTIGAAGKNPVAPTSMALAHFFQDQHELYREARRVADVVLLRPTNIDAVLNPGDQPIYLQTESALVSHRILFSVALDPALPSLKPDQVLVVTGEH